LKILSLLGKYLNSKILATVKATTNHKLQTTNFLCWHKIFTSLVKKINMEIDRNDEIKDNDAIPGREPSLEKDQEKALKSTHYTEVENAHASGLGSMGRSDEKLKDKDKNSRKGDNIY
jgi:hypothetical protein